MADPTPEAEAPPMPTPPDPGPDFALETGLDEHGHGVPLDFTEDTE